MRTINTQSAPRPAGHYSQAIAHAGLVFVAGQVPRQLGAEGPSTDSIVEQTRLVLRNLCAILEAANSGQEYVIKVTVYLVDAGEWGQVNEIYGEFFGEHRPARTIVPVPVLRHNYRIEMDAVAAEKPSAVSAPVLVGVPRI